MQLEFSYWNKILTYLISELSSWIQCDKINLQCYVQYTEYMQTKFMKIRPFLTC